MAVYLAWAAHWRHSIALAVWRGVPRPSQPIPFYSIFTIACVSLSLPRVIMTKQWLLWHLHRSERRLQMLLLLLPAAAAAVATTVATADELTHRYKYSNQFKSNHHESHRIQLQLHAPMVGLNITSSVLWRAKSAQGLCELATGFFALSDQSADCSLSFKLLHIFMELLKLKIMPIVEGKGFILCTICWCFC